MSFQNGRTVAVMAAAVALAGARCTGWWGDADASINAEADRYPPRWSEPKSEGILRHVAIAKAKKKRAAKQARRQRRRS